MTVETATGVATTRVIPIGGVGEFGANATIIQTPQTTILVDYGMMFPPDHRQPGVDFYINDPELLLETFPDLSALFLTHAHEDHIGGVPYLLAARNMPVYTMPYTARMVRQRCENLPHPASIHEVTLNQPVPHGDMRVEFIGVTHSIAQACALSIDTPDGRIVHTGDFKVDPLPPDQYPFQSQRLRELGDEGVDLLIMDSTNALKKGFCPSDHEIMPHIDKLIRTAKGRVFFTTFSSHMPRIKKLQQIALGTKRKLAMVGRGFVRHFEISQDTRYLERGPEVTTVDHAITLEDSRQMFVITGSQGETQSALMRILRGDHKLIQFKSGDRIIFSSKTIPGNERAIALLASELERRGVEVYTDKHEYVHTSGHGYREDIAYMLALTQPKTVAPIHGEFVQLLNHYHWLNTLIDESQDALLIEDGDVLALRAEGGAALTERVETRLIPMDGCRSLPLTPVILRDRKDMMYGGLILINAEIEGAPEHNSFEISINGLVEEEQHEVSDRLLEALTDVDFRLILTKDETIDLLYRTARKAMKKIMPGRPLIKIVMNGVIVR